MPLPSALCSKIQNCLPFFFFLIIQGLQELEKSFSAPKIGIKKNFKLCVNWELFAPLNLEMTFFLHREIKHSVSFLFLDRIGMLFAFSIN